MAIYSAYGSPLHPFQTTDPWWDDISGQVQAANIDSSSTRINFDYSEAAIGFDDDARYTEEALVGRIQLKHRWKHGTNLMPHIHWVQNQNAVPNWLLEIRAYNNGEVLPAYSLDTPANGAVFPYTSGTIVQITGFHEIDMSLVTEVSGWVDYKLYRDTANASGLFAGADPYTGTALLKELDFHFLADTLGSQGPFTKE